MNFQDFDFVEAPGVLGPSKSGVGCSAFAGLFKCYVFGFVEAVLVFPRHVPTKSEAPTPPGQFFGV